MKKNYLTKKAPYVVSIAFATLFCGCSLLGPTIASYDQYAYIQTVCLKVDALHLMDSAVCSYQSELNAIVTVEMNLQKLYEYDKNRPMNAITVKQWQILLDTNGHLLGGFLVRWRDNKVLKKPFIHDVKALVDSSFSQIARLESKKMKIGR